MKPTLQHHADEARSLQSASPSASNDMNGHDMGKTGAGTGAAASGTAAPKTGTGTSTTTAKH